MMVAGNFKDDLVAEIPSLRAFAASLCGSVTLADDLVQDTLLRAWSNSDKFQPGTSLRAWLFKISQKRLLFALPEAIARSSGHRRHLFRARRDNRGPREPSRSRRLSQSAGDTSPGAARGADDDWRDGTLL